MRAEFIAYLIAAAFIIWVFSAMQERPEHGRKEIKAARAVEVNP